MELPHPYRSYAVVDDANWEPLMKVEKKVLSSWSEKKRLKYISEASTFVGSLLECPECSRVVLSRPGAEQDEVYALDG